MKRSSDSTKNKKMHVKQLQDYAMMHINGRQQCCLAIEETQQGLQFSFSNWYVCSKTVLKTLNLPLLTANSEELTASDLRKDCYKVQKLQTSLEEKGKKNRKNKGKHCI